jgi:hypothetical protein
VQEVVKTGLLTALRAETDSKVQTALGALVAVVAAEAGGEGCALWPALLPNVFSLAQSEDPAARVLSLKLFAELANADGAVLLTPHVPTLHQVMAVVLADPDNNVAVAAVEAAVCMLVALEDRDARLSFHVHLPAMLAVLAAALNRSDTPQPGVDALKALVELVTNEPLIIREYLEPACTAMLTVVNAGGLEDE